MGQKQKRSAISSKAGLRLWALVLAFAAIAAVPTSAGAAPSRFLYEMCDPALPGGNAPTGIEFTVNPGVPIAPFNNCASPGGSIGIQAYGQHNATFAILSFSVPGTPGGFIESLTMSGGAVGLYPGNDNTWIYEPGWPAAGGAGETQRIARVASAPSAYFGPDIRFPILLNCNGATGPCGAGPTVYSRYIVATEVDPLPPTLSGITGSLLAGGILRGDQQLGADAADKGGGLSRVDFLVNGLPAGLPTVGNCNLAQVRNPSVEGTVGISVTPCPTSLKSSWTLDTAAYPFHDGANVVQVCASDFSTLNDPNKTCSVPATVTVDNSCTESPVPGGQVIDARFARSAGEDITVPFRRAAKVTGELSSAAGDAISGATICVQAQTQGSAAGPKPVATTTTDAQGHFTYKVPPGPNRRFLVGYRSNSFQVARSLGYHAHIKPTIELSRGRVSFGGEVRIRGELPGKQAGGRVVVLQAGAVNSKKWYTFDRATTNSAGVYRARVTFDATTAKTTYGIRAVVPRQRDFPWEVGHSSPAFVVVGE